MARRQELRGATVVLTGASSGLGRTTAGAFAACGARLVLAARSREGLEAAAADVAAAGSEVLVVPTDIADADQVDALAAAAVERFGGIDVWVDAAAMVVAGRIGTERPEEVRRLVDTNVLGTYLTSRAALARFREQGRGTLIIVGSILGYTPNPVVPAYVMSKFAIRGLALVLQREVADAKAIHVCLVAPGPIDTPLFQRAANHTGRRLRAIPPAYAPERVASAIVRCAVRPRAVTTAGAISRCILGAHRVAPATVEKAVAAWSQRTVVRPTEPAEDGSGTLFAPDPRSDVHGGWRRGRARRSLGEALGRAQIRRSAGAGRAGWGGQERDVPEVPLDR